MSAEIRVYREGYNTIFPADAPDPESALHGLIRNYVELYVNTGQPELVAYLPSQTTILDLRRENLFYHYRPADTTALAEEFRELLDVLDEPDISDGGDNSTEQARTEGLPGSLIESGIFQEGWSLDKSERSTQLPFEFADAEPAFPGLSRLQREVVLDLLGEQRLVLGIEDMSAGLQAIQYLLTTDRNVRVAIATREDATNLSMLDLVLVPGAERNFAPFDSESASALNDKTGDKIDNYTADLKSDARDAIDQLAAATDLSDQTVYRDLQKIERHLREGESVDVATTTASKVIEITGDIETSDHLNASDRSEVSQTILEDVERAQKTVAERIKETVVPPITEAIESLKQRNSHFIASYDQLDTASEILTAEYRTEIADRDATRPELETISEQWQTLLTKTEPEDPIRDVIRAELREEIDSAQNSIQEPLTKEVNRRLRDELQRASHRHGRTSEEYIQRIHTVGQVIAGDQTIQSLPRQTQSELQPVVEFITSNEVDERLRSRIRDRLRKKLSSELLDVYTERVKARIDEFHTRSSDLGVGWAELRATITDDDISRRTRDRALQEALDDIRNALDDPHLLQNEETRFRTEIEKTVDAITARRKKQYTEKIDSLLQDIENIRPRTARVGKVKIYDQLLSVIDNDGVVSSDYVTEAQQFGDIWRSVRDDQRLSAQQKADLVDETRERIEQKRDSAQPTPGAPNDSSHSSGTSSGTFGLDDVPIFAVVVVFIILLILLALVISPSLPFLSSGSAPSAVNLESPTMGGDVTGSTILVRGTTTADSVTVTFTPVTGPGELLNVEPAVENGRFEHSEALPVGSYLVTVGTGENETDSVAFTYLGDSETGVSIDKIETEQRVTDGTAESDRATATPTATPLPDPTATSASNGTGIGNTSSPTPAQTPTPSPTPTATPTPEATTGSYDVIVRFEATGPIDRIALELYTSDGRRIDATIVENSPGVSRETLTTDQPGAYIVEVSSPGVDAESLEDRRAITVE